LFCSVLFFLLARSIVALLIGSSNAVTNCALMHREFFLCFWFFCSSSFGVGCRLAVFLEAL
jgi:hypothetical protein